jgi:hypothetical protein
MLKNPLRLGNFYTGLSSLGKLEQGKWQELTNCEIHNEIGIVTNNFAMETESTTPNENCVFAQDQSGNVYACSQESGKIWKRTTSAVWSLIRTNANGAHRGAKYFNGYLWYWTATKLGTYDLSSTFNDSFATGTDFREGIEANNTLLIANGRYIARVDSANTFDATSFKLPAQFKATCLKNIGDDVLIGTYISSDTASCKVFLWDSVSTAWTYEDTIPEIGINCFISIDNLTLAQCGTSGNFYYWTGSQMAYFNKISGITTGLGEQKSVSLNGRPLYANGTEIYSIHRQNSSLPYAICVEYTCSSTVNALTVQGQTLLASTGSQVEKKGADYATAVIETPEIQAGINKVLVGYDTYPEGITISTNMNGQGYVTQTPRIDDVKKEIWFDGGQPQGSTMQVKVTLTPSGASKPKVKYISLQ